VATFYQASEQLSGDFFDIYQEDDKIIFFIGDVVGHGTPAALVMAATKGLFVSLTRNDSPLSVVSEANRILCGLLGTTGIFITVVFGAIDLNRNQLQMISAGHNPSILLQQVKINYINSSGLPLGLFPQSSWNLERFSFSRGDRLFLCTDGILETKNNVREQFGMERLSGTLCTGQDYSPSKQIEYVWQAACQFCDNQFNDDVAMLAIRRK
jgi:sigma-B regulation protein RsbU (phosphoserine phosphatase)